MPDLQDPKPGLSSVSLVSLFFSNPHFSISLFLDDCFSNPHRRVWGKLDKPAEFSNPPNPHFASKSTKSALLRPNPPNPHFCPNPHFSSFKSAKSASSPEFSGTVGRFWTGFFRPQPFGFAPSATLHLVAARNLLPFCLRNPLSCCRPQPFAPCVRSHCFISSKPLNDEELRVYSEW